MESGEMIAYCGLSCDSCPMHVLSFETEGEFIEKKKAGIIQLIQEKYNLVLQPEDNIACDGCKTEGWRLFSGCWNCAIRACAKQRKVENCAVCSEYACEELKRFFEKDPEAQTRLENIRNAVKR